jgi:two-component sensor histidine kinase
MMLHAEANHRIANNLTALAGLVRVKAMRARTAADAEALLFDISGRIETVGRLHRLLAAAKDDQLNIGDYLRQVCDAMNAALTGGAVAFDFDVDDGIEAPAELGLPLGMLTAELVTNSVKYAHPTGVPLKLKVACARIAGCELDYQFEDDGVGFPEGFDPNRDGGLGMQLVRSLSAQMQGRGKWTSSALGLGYRVIVPAEARRRTNGDAR